MNANQHGATALSNKALHNISAETAIPVAASREISAQNAANDSNSVPVCSLVSTKQLAKSFDLIDGVIIKTPAAEFSCGRAGVGYIDSLMELPDFFSTLDETNVITCGIPDIPDGDTIEITTKSHPMPGAIARTKADFPFPKGPALLPFDHDDGGYTADKLMEALAVVMPEIKETGYLVRGSTSSAVHKKGEVVSDDPLKYHMYMIAKDGRDIERFGKTLHQRLILKRYGMVNPSS